MGYEEGLENSPGGLPESSILQEINNSGQIVDWTWQEGQSKAFIWDKGSIIYLGTLGGWNSKPFDINGRGQVVGYSTTLVGDLIGSARRGIRSGLRKIKGGNRSMLPIPGTLFPTGSVPSWSLQAFLWEGGTIYNLNNLISPDSGWVLTEAAAINDSGQIVGQGYKGW